MASCPECGDDLSEMGTCPACGYRLPPQVTTDGHTDTPNRAFMVQGLVDLEAAPGGVTPSEPEKESPAPGGEAVSEEPPLGPQTAAAAGFVDSMLSSRSDSAPVEHTEIYGPVELLLLPAPVEPAASGTVPSKDREVSWRRPQRDVGRRRLIRLYLWIASVVVIGAAATYLVPRLQLSGSRGQTQLRSVPPPSLARTKSSPAPVLRNPADLRLPRGTNPIDLTSGVAGDEGLPVLGADSPPTTSEGAYVSWMSKNTGQNEGFLKDRWNLVATALRAHEIDKRRIRETFLLTPREWFCRPYNLPEAYADRALPIGYGQMIPSPSLALRMLSLLDPAPGEKVLEIGTGSGYEAALLARLTGRVYTIEIVKPLAEETNQIFDEHLREMPGLADIHRRIADGYYGWAKEAPFDRIIVTAGIDHLPPDLLSQLGPGGVMVVPIGPPSGQTLLKVTKEVGEGGKTTFVRKAIPDSRVVLLPMTNASGGTHDAND